jgi:signal transduction histidine kinase
MAAPSQWSDVLEPPALADARLKATTWIGLALTVGVWLFAGAYFGRRIGALEIEASTMSARYVRSQQLLTSARTQVLLSSTYVVEGLLETTPEAAADSRDRISIALSQADRNLADYVPILDSEAERARLARLRQEIEEFQSTTAKMLVAGPARDLEDIRVLRRRQIRPRREAILAVAEELSLVDHMAFVDHQRDIGDIYRRTQTRIWAVLGLALAASLGIALWTAQYASRLADRVRAQHERDVDRQRDLRRLSGRLIRVREQERRALARELHDEIGQLLTAIKVELALAQRAIDARGGPHDVLDDARPIADRALQAVRDLSHMLHPSVLDDLGLPAAAEWLIKQFTSRHDLQVEFQVAGQDARLMPEVETAAYRIIQEALTNVVKHAHARSVVVSLDIGERVRLTIEDDGAGFARSTPPDEAAHRGLGLVSMRERAAQFGGELRLESLPGRGTRVIADLPAWSRDMREASDVVVSAPAAAGAPIGHAPTMRTSTEQGQAR